MFKTVDQVIERMNQIKDLLASPDADLDALSAEMDTLVERRKEIQLEEGKRKEARETLISRINEGIVVPEVVEKPSNVESDEMIERKQFMDWIVTGKMSTDSVLKRADATGTSQNLGVMIPHHVQQEIIKELDKITGRLYTKVKKTNLPGGVEYPIGSFAATFHRITETTVSDRQNPGGITGSVIFKYNIGEIRLARTLLQTVLSVPAFEVEFAKVVAQAYVTAMDIELLNGVPADGELEGILGNTKVKTITLTDEDMKDWKAIQKKVFAKLPLAMKSKPYEFAMSNGTYEGNIKTLVDDSNKPVYGETFNPVDGVLDCRFKGHLVTLVEPEVLPDFDDAEEDDAFGMLWVPNECYAINSNMEFSVVKYFDHEKNQEVTKALVINDGKVLRPDLIYILKKGAVEEEPKEPVPPQS